VAVHPIEAASAAIKSALQNLPLDYGVVLQVSLELVEPADADWFVRKRDVRVCKSEEVGEERYVLGIVLEPDTVDSQGDIYTAETIRQTAYTFMEEYRNIGLQHGGCINDSVKILESWIQRESTVIGAEMVVAGTWMLAVRVLDDDLWQAVKDGRITGFSIGGTGKRTPLAQ